MQGKTQNVRLRLHPLDNDFRQVVRQPVHSERLTQRLCQRDQNLVLFPSALRIAACNLNKFWSCCR
jgi:hypothetical protein